MGREWNGLMGGEGLLVSCASRDFEFGPVQLRIELLLLLLLCMGESLPR